MPRRPRAEFEAAIHHVFARGNRKEAIFLDDVDRHSYLALLRRAVTKHRWRCLSYCLMENHVHLLVETREPNLGRGMHFLHGRYAQTFNARHERVGHLFQGRYGSTTVASDAQLLQTARYIARNPLEAGLCRRAEEYAWGSHAVVREAPPWLDHARLLAHFGADGGDPADRYRRFVDDGDETTGAAGAVPAQCDTSSPSPSHSGP